LAIAPTVISIVGKFTDQATPGIEKLSGNLSGLGAAARTAGQVVAVGMVAVATGITAVVSQATSAVKSLDALTSASGVTAEKMQELQFVAESLGSDAGALAKGISSLSLEIGKGSTVSKATAQALSDLNIPIKELIGLDAEGKFARVRDALSEIPSPTDRARIGTELLGTAYKNLGPLVTASSAALLVAQVRLDEIGGPVGDKALEKVRDISSAWTAVKTAASNASVEIAAIISPAVVAGLDAVSASLGFVRFAFTGGANEAAKLGQEIAALEAKAKFFEKDRSSSGKDRYRALMREAEELRKREQLLLGVGISTPTPPRVTVDVGQNPAVAAALKSEEQKARFQQAVASMREVSVSSGRTDVQGLPAGATGTERAVQRVIEIRAAMEIEFEKGISSAKQYNERLMEVLENAGGLEEVIPKSKKIIEQAQAPINEMAAMQERAAQSVQDAFVSAFSNIDQGLGGMVKGFLKAFAQILAQAAALDLAKALNIGKIFGGSGAGGGGSSTGSFVGSLIKGFFGRAGGGLVSGAAVVGEDGPELLLSGGTSMVMNKRQLAFNSGGGGMAYSPTTNIIVQGDVNRESEARLLAYIEITRSKDQREMMRVLERNGMRNIR